MKAEGDTLCVGGTQPGYRLNISVPDMPDSVYRSSGLEL